jgi:nitrate/TMAO reductase-like tetraheme cytochrome c subunit
MSNAVRLDVVSVLAGLTLGVSAVAAGILIVYWVKQPRLDLKWRLLLFLAIALLPTVAAGTSTTEALNVTSERQFCGSCHVMEAHYNDAIDPASMSLAARHTRNEAFGEHSCYQCHAEYGMLGYPLTKLNGLRHVWHYYFGEYGSMTLEEALPKLHTYKPYPNGNCTHCHTGSGKLWLAVPDHRAVDAHVRAGTVSCASIGCHGAPHPDSARARAAAAMQVPSAATPASPAKAGEP